MYRPRTYSIIAFALLVIILLYCPATVAAQESIDLEASILANASSGEFAPYMIGALNHGKATQKNGALIDVAMSKSIDPDDRKGFGFGVEALAGATSRTDYMRWDEIADSWASNPQGPAPLWLQQMYAEAKYRCLYIMAGMKEHSPTLVNPELSSGDFVESGNARPIPEVRAGFFDFVDIPFTNGWLQIQGQVGYGFMPDTKYMEHHYNYYNYHITKNSLYNYKYCYFRTNPNARFMATFGMQSGGLFGGTGEYYNDGVHTHTNKYKTDLGSFFNMLLPVFNNAETFLEGSSLGSWDFYGQYMLNGGDEIAAYFQWPFEDGSSLGRRNKLDGLWGIEYRSNAATLISGIVVEYIDFRDQSGPIHFAPADFDNPTITSEATGRDNYYNNGFYNAYANYGMAIGTPFLISPIYNTDGFPGFACNRANGVHVGINGYLSESLKYRLLFSYQRGFGTYDYPYSEMRTDTSWLAEGIYTMSSTLSVMARVAMDRGTLRGNNFGAQIALSYRGAIDNLFGR